MVEFWPLARTRRSKEEVEPLLRETVTEVGVLERTEAMVVLKW